MAEPWRITLLGSLRAQCGERVITRFKYQKVGGLLAFLSFHRHQMHSREVLVEMFWPDGSPEAARNSLSAALSSLRHQFEPPGTPSGAVLRADRYSIGINPEMVVTDVALLEACVNEADRTSSSTERRQHLEHAVALYQGHLLPGFYEDWISPEQVRLSGLYFDTVLALVRDLEQQGDLSSALRYGRLAVSVEPLREEAHQNLMRLLLAAGQPGAALRQYKELERLLDEELGDEPSAPLRALARHIEKETGLTAPALSATVMSPAPRWSSGGVLASSAGQPATLTFLLADVEVLPRQLGRSHSTELADHQALLRKHLVAFAGQLIKETDGAFVAAFPTAQRAIECAVAGQQALLEQDVSDDTGPPQVRMAVHTGDVELVEGEYRGSAMHRASRVLTAGHAGQILVSSAAAELARGSLPDTVKLVDLGVYRLPDVAAPERLYEVEYPESAARATLPLNAARAQGSIPPVQFTRFFGREAEIAAIVEVLSSPQTRLLTLTGSGGTGKTRLCIEAAGRYSEAYTGSIWFVPLADLSEPSQIYAAILQAMGVPLQGTKEPVDQVVTALSAQPCLLLLDNFEHLASGGAELLQRLMDRVPSLQSMVTSRQTLNLPAEIEFGVSPLPTPNGADTPERLGQFASVQLFVDRAQAAKPDFRISSGNAPAVAEICDRLEGIPLAIELAAARALVLTPAQMLVQLGNRFEFLVSRRRGVAERQRTMRAAVDWSYKLLSPELQRFFSKLSVFRGGWTLEAAEAVCEEPLALDYLEYLKDCSMVLPEESGESIGFRMLETLREFAHEQLSSEDVERVRERHTDFFLKLADKKPPDIHALSIERIDMKAGTAASELRAALSPMREWADRMEADYDNLRVVLQRGQDGPGAEWLLDFAMACRPFWRQSGRYWEGLRSLVDALATTVSETPLRAEALYWCGFFAKNRRDFTQALRFHHESLRIWQAVGDPEGTAATLIELGNTYTDPGDFASARPLYEEALEIDRVYLQGRKAGEIYLNLGVAVNGLGDRVTARVMILKSQSLARNSPRIQIWTRYVLGGWDAEDGNNHLARMLYREALTIAGALGDRREIAQALTCLAALQARDGANELATRSLGAASELLGSFALQHPPIAADPEALRSTLGDAAFSAAWEAGRAMTWEQAVALALEEEPL